jgi:hypothetical protein
MAHVSGNPTWRDYPLATTPISAARLEGLERVLDGDNPLAQAGVRTGKLRMTRHEAVAVGASQSFTLLEVAGPGVVQSVWMAVSGGVGACLDGRLRVFYDGSATPAIDTDLGTLLATHFAADGANHITPHLHVEINKTTFENAFLLTFPMPFGTSIKVTYQNSPAPQPATVWAMLTYRLTATDDAAGLRLRCSGARYLDQAITRASNATNVLLNVSGGPGWIVSHSYVAGAGASNTTWLARNVQVQVDGEATPQIVSSGTDNWFDSGWLYFGRRDYSIGRHSYVGASQPPAPNQYAAGQVTDLLSKWGGVPFESAAVMSITSKAACTTGDTFSYAVLYYQRVSTE